MKLFGKVVACMAFVGVLMIAPITSGLFTAEAQAAVQPQQPGAAQPVEDKMQNGTSLLGWGIFIYAAGEVGGALALGIAHARRVKRQEQKEKLQQQQAPKGAPVLLYSEYNEALIAVK